MEDGHARSLATLHDLAQRARQIVRDVQLDFLAVNGTHALAPYRQAVLWSAAHGVNALSDAVEVDAETPWVQELARICAWRASDAGTGPAAMAAPDLPPALRTAWTASLPAAGLWLPLPSHGGPGGLLLARDMPWRDGEIALLATWAAILRPMYAARCKPQRGTLAVLRQALGL
jgi:hypothetical protein